MNKNPVTEPKKGDSKKSDETNGAPKRSNSITESSSSGDFVSLILSSMLAVELYTNSFQATMLTHVFLIQFYRIKIQDLLREILTASKIIRKHYNQPIILFVINAGICLYVDWKLLTVCFILCNYIIQSSPAFHYS